MDTWINTFCSTHPTDCAIIKYSIETIVFGGITLVGILYIFGFAGIMQILFKKKKSI